MSVKKDVTYAVPELSDVDDVLEALNYIIEVSKNDNNNAAIFAYVYYRTTAKVKEGIEEGRFRNCRRMIHFDVAFARKYIEAYWNYAQGLPVPETWELAFTSCHKHLSVMQHILLGMNAHINLDLGVTVSEFATDEELEDLKYDFLMINRMLKELINEMQSKINNVSPLLFFLDRLAGSADEATVNFYIIRFRTLAWEFAQRLIAAPEEDRATIIAEVDQQMSNLGQRIAQPPGIVLRGIANIIRSFEVSETQTVIERLHNHNPADA